MRLRLKHGFRYVKIWATTKYLQIAKYGKPWKTTLWYPFQAITLQKSRMIFLKKAVEKGKRLKTLSVFTKRQQMFGQWNPFLPCLTCAS